MYGTFSSFVCDLNIYVQLFLVCIHTPFGDVLLPKYFYIYLLLNIRYFSVVKVRQRDSFN